MSLAKRRRLYKKYNRELDREVQNYHDLVLFKPLQFYSHEIDSSFWSDDCDELDCDESLQDLSDEIDTLDYICEIKYRLMYRRAIGIEDIQTTTCDLLEFIRSAPSRDEQRKRRKMHE